MATALDEYFISEQDRIISDIREIGRAKGRVSQLIRKGPLPDGVGYDFKSIVMLRSGISGGGWTPVATPDGNANNCYPTAGVVGPALQTYDYAAEMMLIKSTKICFEDARRGVQFKKQVESLKKQIAGNVADAWEDKDTDEFGDACGIQISFDGTSPTEGTSMPASEATSPLNQTLLDSLRQRLLQDGAGMEAYAQSDGSPLLTLILSMEQQAALLATDTTVRQDIQYAEMGKGYEATLLSAWGSKRNYRGFTHVVNIKMPRWNFTGGAWVRVPYYTTGTPTLGTSQPVNPAYLTAGYEDVFIWHPDVVKRLVPAPLGSVGGGTTGEAVNWNGQVLWKNIPSEDENILGNTGFYIAPLMAAYEPGTKQYGVRIRVKRCNLINTTSCY